MSKKTKTFRLSNKAIKKLDDLPRKDKNSRRIISSDILSYLIENNDLIEIWKKITKVIK